MKHIKYLPLLVAVCVLFAVSSSGESADFDSLYDTISDEISAERAYEYVTRIWRYDKWCTLPMWNESAAEVGKIMRERGFDEASVVDTPADGKTQHGDWTNPIGWDCRHATLEVLEPEELTDDMRFLCNYQVNPSCLTFFSCPTPPDGIEAELVILERSTPEELAKLDARGKIILVSSRAGYLKQFLARNGVLGILSDQQVGPYDNANAWLNTWSDFPGGWLMHGSDSREQFCFSISAEKGRRLRHMIARGERVKLRAKIDSRYFTDGSLPYVTGAVHGTGDQEVLIGGHLFEWGANDNATGCAIMLESVGTLNDLIRSGVLPRPKRTIRIWMGQEMYGSLAFTERYMDNLRRTVAAVCCDTPAPDWDLNASTVKVFMNPNVCPTYTDALYPEFWRSHYRRTRANKQVLIEPFEGGTDTYFCEPMIGAPTNFVYMENGTWLHHNSRDTLEKVDKRSLRDLCVVNALYLYYMADAGSNELPEIARLAYDRGVEVIHGKTAEMKLRSAEMSDGITLGRVLAEGEKTIEYYTEQQVRALNSIVRLVDPGSKSSAEEKLSRYTNDIRVLGEICVKQFRNAVADHAKENSIKIVQYKRKRSDWDREAETIYPKATEPGTLTLEGIPREAWVEVTSSPRWWSTRNWAAASYWWCDGTRNLSEIRDLIEMEAGRQVENFDLIRYYRFLEKYDRVEIVTKQ